MDRTLNEYYISTYNYKYSPKDFLDALEFYFKTLDDFNQSIISNASKFISRKDLYIISSFLKTNYTDRSIVGYRTSGPSIKPIFDDMANLRFKVDSLEYLADYYVGHLIMIQDISIHIMCIFNKFYIEKNLTDLDLKDKIQSIINEKYILESNKDNYPLKYYEEMKSFLDIKDKYLKEIGDVNLSTTMQDLKKLVDSNKNKIQTIIDSNDLEKPIYQEEFELFISRLKELLFIPSYYDIVETDLERVFHIYTLAVLVGTLKLYKVESNKESGLGRLDIVLIPIDVTKHCVIIEIKQIDKMPIVIDFNKAISQIRNKNYIHEYKRSGFTKFLYIALIFFKKEPFIHYELEEV